MLHGDCLLGRHAPLTFAPHRLLISDVEPSTCDTAERKEGRGAGGGVPRQAAAADRKARRPGADAGLVSRNGFRSCAQMRQARFEREPQKPTHRRSFSSLHIGFCIWRRSGKRPCAVPSLCVCRMIAVHQTYVTLLLPALRMHSGQCLDPHRGCFCQVATYAAVLQHLLRGRSCTSPAHLPRHTITTPSSWRPLWNTRV